MPGRPPIITSRSITAAVTVVIVLLGSCSGTDVADDDLSATTATTSTTLAATIPDGWQQIDRAVYGFTFQLPAQWSVETRSELDAYMGGLPTADTIVPDLDQLVEETQAIVAFNAGEAGTGTNITVTMEPRDETVEDVLGGAEAGYPALITSIGGVTQSVERTMLDGHEALHVVFTMDTDSVPLTVHQYLVSTSPLQTVTFVTGNPERDGPTLEQITSTYRIVD